MFLEIDGVEKDYNDIRSEKSVYRFNNFNVSEDTTQNTITFRPVVIGCYSYFKIISSTSVKIDIVKNGTTTVAKEFDIPSGETKIEFEPKGVQSYIMRLNDSALGNIPMTPLESNASNQISQEDTSHTVIDPFQNPFGDFGGFDSSSSISNTNVPTIVPMIEEEKEKTSPSASTYTSFEQSVSNNGYLYIYKRELK